MTRLSDVLPLLDEVPPLVGGLGLSLESDVDELRACSEDDRALSRLLQSFVPHLIEADDRKLAALLPGLLVVQDAAIGTAVLKNRSLNALSLAGIRTWAGLAQLSPRELGLLPNVGGLTLGDILERCLEAAVLGLPAETSSTGDPASDGVHDPGSLVAESATNILRIISAWASSERNVSRLGDLWEVHPTDGALPPDLAELWRKFADMSPSTLASPTITSTPFEDLIDDLLGSLEETQREVYERRLLTAHPATLEEVGQTLGFTRERARQIQVKAQERIDSIIQTDRFRPILWRASDLRGVLGLAALRENEETANALERCLRGVSSARQEITSHLLLRIAGPYKERDGWLELIGAPVVLGRDLANLADVDGLIAIDSAYAWLAARGVDAAFQDAWIERAGQFRRFDAHLAVWSGSIVDKCVALLALHAQPADAETLVTEVGEGHSVRGARNRFFSDPRLMRVNRTQWALRSWGLEEYTGITDEIAQRIETGGGRIRLDDIVADLTVQFGVKEGSVKVYAEAPMFVVEDGWVRLRGDDEPFRTLGELAACRGSYLSGADRVSLLLSVDHDTLRGSGRSCPAPIADFLGVSPGRPRAFRWNGGELLVTWPRTAALGPSIGSTRAIAASVQASEGDSLRLDFDLSSGEVAGSLVPASLESLPSLDALKSLTGLDLGRGDDLLERLARALRVSASEVRRRLVDRGDGAVAALLPRPEINGALELALSDLAELLDDLD